MTTIEKIIWWILIAMMILHGIRIAEAGSNMTNLSKVIEISTPESYWRQKEYADKMARWAKEGIAKLKIEIEDIQYGSTVICSSMVVQ